MAAGAESVETAASGMAWHSRTHERAVWAAQPKDAEGVAALMGGQDHLGKDRPGDDEIRATVDVLLEDSATELLLAARDGQEAAAGVCQLRLLLAVWTGADDCWLEDLYVDGRRGARASGARSWPPP